MEKNEWRETFNRQPSYYLFLDLTAPINVENINTLCQVLRDVLTLSVSLKGSLRLSTLGIYALCNRTKCIFPLQNIKSNCAKLYFSIDCFQNATALYAGKESFDLKQLKESLQDAVHQYETFYQTAVMDKEKWPQLQLVIFSAQPTPKLLSYIQDSLVTVELAYIRKVQMVMLKDRGLSSSSSEESRTDIPDSQNDLEDQEKESIIRSLLHVTEIEPNAFHMESILKSWLHDSSSDSEHIRLSLGSLTIRCDLHECLMPPELQTGLNLGLDTAPHHAAAAVSKGAAGKAPVYALQALAVLKKEGVCESVLFGQPFIAVSTRCWKLDWSELELNQHRFGALCAQLRRSGSVLLAARRAHPAPAAFFALFPAPGALLIKPLASREILMPPPFHQEGREVPEEVELETRMCLESLEEKEIYNPMSESSGLYSILSSSLSKCKSRPSTNFVVPIIRKDQSSARKKKGDDESSTEETFPHRRTDFLTASAMLKKRFPNEL